jgi:hypothetical protein
MDYSLKNATNELLIDRSKEDSSPPSESKNDRERQRKRQRTYGNSANWAQQTTHDLRAGKTNA